MIKTVIRLSPVTFSILLPLDLDDHDKVSKDVKTAKDFEHRQKSDETGIDRLKKMFTIDEFGRMSTEFNSITQAGFLGMLVGAAYGGFIQSRLAYLNFMENNQATAFKSHLDAKKKLQDQVTINFAKGAFRWGWRLAAFTTSYIGITTVISVYREKSSIYEYLVAGGITGCLYKANMGLRGMCAGGLVGLAFGGIAGSLSLIILKFSGTSMEEVRYWQYKWREQRDNDILLGTAKQFEIPDPLMKAHNEKFPVNHTLDKLNESEKK